MPTPTPWTPAQLDAIRSTGVSLLVSAAAGSGKTAVLAERCAHLVCSADDPCGVDELLVVTFTDAAAAEMKSRIVKALRNKIDRPDGPGDAHLARQLELVERAQVSTLHGFCSRLLRQHFHMLGLDPNFGVLDGDEAELLRQEVVREMFAERYETDETGEFQGLIDVYGDGDDDPLMSRVIHTYELLQSVADQAGWMAAARERLAEGAEKPLRHTAVGRELGQHLRRKLSDLMRRADEGVSLLSGMEGFKSYAAQLAELKAVIDEWGQAFGDGNFDALAAAIGAFELPRKPTVRGNPPGKAVAVAAIDSVRDDLGKEARESSGSLLGIARFTEAQWTDGLRRTRAASNLFLDLVDEFAGRYRDAKEAIRKVDFSDLEVFTLHVLTAGDTHSLAPSGAARSYQRQFKHVLVDEYQDINEVQDAILRLVSREGGAGKRAATVGNLFCVGDVKQSIYGFRLAEPARFLERDRIFRAGGAAGRVIDLQSNFRSRGPLLDSLNALFERLMTEATAGIDYDESQKLVAGLTYPSAGDAACFSGAPVELHVLPRSAASVEERADEDDPAQEMDRTEREAAFIAHRIHEMMGHMDAPRMQVVQKNEATGELEPHPIRFRDIVILLRSMRYKADQFATILNAHGIPTHRDTGTGYFSSMEVRDVLALLHVLDNQQQDIPLAAVLRSPIAKIPKVEDSLAKIVLAYSRGTGLQPVHSDQDTGYKPVPRGSAPVPFHEAVVRYAAEQTDALASILRDFLNRLDRWRQLARQRPLAELIWTLYTETGYLAFCAGLQGGEQRVANLVYLHERARQFGSFARQGLYRFLQFLQSLENQRDLGQPSVLSEADDVVRVMSVHRSKGLEFPVVFLPDLGKRINMAGCSGSILVDRHAYLGLAVPDEEKRVRYPSLALMLVQARLREQAIAEELRVLYVAATRAREHLVLIGTAEADKVEKWRGRYGDCADVLPAEMVLSAGSMLDWIGPAAASLEKAGRDHFTIAVHSSQAVNDWRAAGPEGAQLSGERARLADFAPLSPAPPSDPAADAIVARLMRVYERGAFTRLAAVHSVTSWAKNGKPVPVVGDAEQPKAALLDRVLALPRIMLESGDLSAADVGTATHMALEHLNFARPCTGADLAAQLAALVERRIMVQAQAEAVDERAVAWFLGTELGHMLRDARSTLRREVPFQLALAPERFPGVPHSDLPEDQVMLRGRIDLVIEQPAGLIVVDYKTDRVKADALDGRVEFYREQVKLYRQALENITGRKVVGVYLVFLAARVVRLV